MGQNVRPVRAQARRYGVLTSAGEPWSNSDEVVETLRSLEFGKQCFLPCDISHHALATNKQLALRESKASIDSPNLPFPLALNIMISMFSLVFQKLVPQPGPTSDNKKTQCEIYRGPFGKVMHGTCQNSFDRAYTLKPPSSIRA